MYSDTAASIMDGDANDGRFGTLFSDTDANAESQEKVKVFQSQDSIKEYFSNLPADTEFSFEGPSSSIDCLPSGPTSYTILVRGHLSHPSGRPQRMFTQVFGLKQEQMGKWMVVSDVFRFTDDDGGAGAGAGSDAPADNMVQRGVGTSLGPPREQPSREPPPA